MADGISITSRGMDAVVRGLAGLRDVDRARMFERLGWHEQELTRKRLDGLIGNNDQRFPPSKTRRAGRASTTLQDTGNMMKAFRPLRWDANGVTMGFGSNEADDKARWAQYGTRRHAIRGKNGPLGPFVASGVGMPSHVIGSRGGKAVKLRRWRGQSGIGVRWAWKVNHPGTPPRPLFGVSPKDATSLMERIREFYLAAAKKAGLNIG